METQNNYHYYGDAVRVLFIVGGLIMLVFYPFFSSFIKAPTAFSIIGVVALVIFAGLMNPRQKWIMVLNTIISISALAVFEYAAVYTYLNLPPAQGVHVVFFWVNQALSLLFFFAAYLSTKTIRGALIN
jgi:hypothetical protein